MLKLFRRKHVDPAAELRAILGDVELPHFPAVIASALDRVRDETTPSADLSNLVAQDPGLTARLLSTVNSAAYGLKHSVKNVDHAISLLGRGELESILISIAVRDTLPRENRPGFEVSRFWKTAARRACAARALADLLAPATRSESFTAALLQDMAVPLLAVHRGESYSDVLQHWHESGEDLASIEAEEFGWHHAEVATSMCAEWRFPEAISEGIGAHHNRDADGGLPAVSLVSCLLEVEEQKGIDRLIQFTGERFGVAHDTTARLIDDSFESAGEIARLFA